MPAPQLDEAGTRPTVRNRDWTPVSDVDNDVHASDLHWSPNAKAFGRGFAAGLPIFGSLFGNKKPKDTKPNVPPPPNGNDNPDDPNNPDVPDDPLTRLSDILAALGTHDIALPSPTDPIVVPDVQSTTSPVPIILILTGVGIAGYYWYKNHKGAN